MSVISAKINKYCYATIIKRADCKIIINSDLDEDIIADNIDELKYNGKLDLVKAAIKIMNPYFGFELYLHNDIPPERGLGSSASFSVLIVTLLNYLMDMKYNDYKIAEMAYKVEREELGIKGGWQDQYATVTGGFNFMEFDCDKSLVYPLRLKQELIDELNSHLLLCYVGRAHSSGNVHQKIENSIVQNEEEKLKILNRMKEIAIEIRDFLLTNRLEDFGRLLRESWESKKKISPSISNESIDRLYETGLQNGAYGGKLLGAGEGGYILFFYQPKKRNELVRALRKEGSEILDFNFEFKGTQIWVSKHKF